MKSSTLPQKNGYYKRNEPEAFGEIVKGLNSKLTSYLQGKLGVRSSQDVEDLLQETYIRLWKKIEHPVNPLRKNGIIPFAYRTIYNLFLDHINSRARRKPQIHFSNIYANSDDENSYDPSDEKPTPLEALVKEEDKNELKQAIGALSSESGTIVNLFYFQERSGKEIANLLTLPLGTVRTRLYRARSKLKKELSRS